MAKLNYRTYGEGEPLIIIHGLYGASDNWVSIARALMSDFKVYVLDMRNHGASPHLEQHNYAVMVDDLLEFMNDNNIFSSNILGHSMGGKVAMNFVALHPERVKRLIIVDISPASYSMVRDDSKVTDHKAILSALKMVDLGATKKRSEVDDFLKKHISSDRIRQFLLKNLARSKDGTFSWKLNVDVLYNSLENVLVGLEGESDELASFNNLVLFIKGGASDYISSTDEGLIKEYFNKVSIVTIKGASHWVHAEKPQEFLDTVMNFLKS